MQSIAPLGYERYAVLVSLVQKHEIESVAAKSSGRTTEPVAAVNTAGARRRETMTRDTTGGNVIARAGIDKAASGRYLEYRLNDPTPEFRIWLGEASNSARYTGSSPVRPVSEVAALYERTNAITAGKTKT
ncbi:MAG TPA: hypothetical protein ENI55_01910 [Alphaproteobacteria bacterium]|nr:hypothetical protein [Alphaproteobacteria bacterium]